MNQAVDDCISDGILTEFLSANRAEVLNLILTEYDEQSHIASEKEISYAEGMERGIESGILIAKQILQLAAAGKTIPEIAEACGVEELFVKEILET